MPRSSAKTLFTDTGLRSQSNAISATEKPSFPLVSDEEEIKLSFINHLRTVRRSRNLTQQDIAAMTGLHYQNISRFERGAGVTLNTLIRYTAALGGTLVFSESTVVKDPLHNEIPEEKDLGH